MNLQDSHQTTLAPGPHSVYRVPQHLMDCVYKNGGASCGDIAACKLAVRVFFSGLLISP